MTDIAPEQQQVLDATDNILVIGRPGSGKTTVALWKAAKRLSEGHLLEHQAVLFLSFSRSAVERIAAAGRLEGLGRTKRIVISTFHSFCHELLVAHSTLAGIKRPLGVLLPEEERVIEHSLGDRAPDEFARLEREESRVRFDRFAALGVQILEAYPALRSAYSEAYPLILVDEYQDTDDKQDELIRMLGERSQVVCLGDPNQRIYDWRPGVCADRLERLQEEHGFRRIDLGDRNHRSPTSGVRAYAQSVLEGQAKAVPSIWVVGSGAKLEHVVAKIRESIGRLRCDAKRNHWGSAGGPSICVMLPTNRSVHEVSRLLRGLPDDEARKYRHDVVVNRDEVGIVWGLVLRLLESGDSGNEQAIAAGIEVLSRYHRYVGKARGNQRSDRLNQLLRDFVNDGAEESPVVQVLGKASCVASASNGCAFHAS